MSNIQSKILTTLIVLLLGQSVLAGSHVRFLCQRNWGDYKNHVFENPDKLHTKLQNEVLVIESTDSVEMPPEKFENHFRALEFDLNFKMTRYGNVPVKEFENPYDSLNNVTRDQIYNVPGNPLKTTRPAKTNAGTIQIRQKDEVGRTIQLTVKTSNLVLTQYHIFNKGNYQNLADQTYEYVCHEPDFFETTIEEEQINIDENSSEFTTY